MVANIQGTRGKKHDDVVSTFLCIELIDKLLYWLLNHTQCIQLSKCIQFKLYNKYIVDLLAVS